VFHIDIVFGPEVAIGNVHYGLLFTDRFSRMTYIYPLKNLTSDIKKQMETFFSHIGIIPKRIISDFDTKLIGGQAREYLNSLLIHVNVAPSHRQDKNGLAERHWQTMISMVRVLFKLFSLAAVCRERIGDEIVGKFDSQSVPMIAIGKCPNSNGLQFYNPINNTFVSSIDYKLLSNETSGTRFGYRYQLGTFIYRLDETTSVFAPKFAIDSQVYVHTHSPPHRASIIGIPTYSRPDIYTVSFADGSIAEYSDQSDLLEAIPPTATITTCQYYLIGLQVRLMQLYFYQICQNHDMVNSTMMIIINGTSNQAIHQIHPNTFI